MSGIVFFFLFLVILMIYWPALSGTFILDDYVWIHPLNWVQIKHLFIGSWEHGNALRPVMRLQFWSSRLLFGEWSFGWHVTNIFLHTLVAGCAFGITKKITNNFWLAMVPAFLFAIFPTNHETVAWISGRTHPFGFLLALAGGYLLYRACTASHRTVAYAVSGYFISLAGFLTYEISFVIPVGLLLVVLVLGPRTRRAWGITVGSFALLIGLLVYRWFILGHTFGSVGAQYSNWLVAPFLNFHQFERMYWYSREIKFLLLFVVLIFIGVFVHRRMWRSFSYQWKLILLFFLLSIFSYAPFSFTKGVAPRFLYSSLFFCLITLALVYDYLIEWMPGWIKKSVWCLVVLVFAFSCFRTGQVVDRYRVVADSYTQIRMAVLRDFPVWPAGRDMLFYGIPDGNDNVLAFLTKFELAVQYGYKGQTVGRVYRSDRSTPAELEKILKTNPVIYKFNGFGQGIERLVK